jgi:quaternary ammonium compound-resistance protein SugE
MKLFFFIKVILYVCGEIRETCVYYLVSGNRAKPNNIPKTNEINKQKNNFNPQKMNWIILIIAGLFEVAFAFCLGKAKETTGNEMYLWYVGFIVTLTFSMVLLIKATQTLPIGTAYAVWTGVGAVGTVLVGILVFKEPATFLRLLFIMTLIGSIIGLKAVSH